MRRIWRLGVLMAAALVAFGVAVVRFERAAEEGCAQRAAADPAYRLDLAAPVQDGDTTYELNVTRDGRPVRGAEVCIGGFLRGMSAMAVAEPAGEVAAGTYRTSLAFPMEGEWSLRVVIDEPGRPAAAVAFELEVG